MENIERNDKKTNINAVITPVSKKKRGSLFMLGGG